MLRSLSIRNVVLIERLELDFQSGLGVLTGETGAGKSILLDALGLALGVRAEARLVRHGAEQASVTAEFEDGLSSSVQEILTQHGIDVGGTSDALLLRRVLAADGRSRAFVNDQPVSVSLLRQLGDVLVEVHGQFESQRLLNPAAHRGLLDSFGELAPQASNVADTWQSWYAAQQQRKIAEAELEKSRTDEEYLRYAADELAAFNPQQEEEDDLAARRAMFMHGEKLMEAMNQALDDLKSGRGVESTLQGALHGLERVADKAEGCLDQAITALSRAASECADGLAFLEKAGSDLTLDSDSLESVEERLFALRALSRKHGVGCNGLCALGVDFAAQVAALEDGGIQVESLRLAEAQARTAYVEVAKSLSTERTKAAARLDVALTGEMEPLKLGKAGFKTAVEILAEDAWGDSGMDRVAFQVATNPGAPMGPLKTIASGGELSRFMLALKVVLAQADPVPTIIFDEVDSGIGGAVAHAVGERLSHLSKDFQVLVVTHSPQVASRGDSHMKVRKSNAEGAAFTHVGLLDDAARKEEIARMLAGANITDEARAAAESLLKGGGSL